MNLSQTILKAFPEGFAYNEAAQLCLRLYCSVEGVPEQLHAECTKSNLALVFAQLASEGYINTPPIEAALYGANFHEVTDEGHWVEVIASIFKKGGTADKDMGSELVRRLTSASMGLVFR